MNSRLSMMSALPFFLRTIMFAKTPVMLLFAISSINGQSKYQYPTRQNGPCEYHPTPSGATAMVLTLPSSSRDLRGDGAGRYFEGNDTVRSYANIAYMLFTYWPETCE